MQGPLNHGVKIWASASEEGWLLPTDGDSWKCTQTLDLKSSAEPRIEEAFFNQVVALPQAGLLLLANAKKNAIYAVHLEYGPNPAATHMDYIAEFTVTMPILSFTGTSISSPGEHSVQVYCVQTQAIQQYALDLSQCLPPPLENVGLDKSDSNVLRDAASVDGFAAFDPTSSKPSDKATLQPSSSESAIAARYPISSNTVEVPTSKETTPWNAEVKSAALTQATSDSDIVCVPSPPIPLSPRLSGKLSGLRSPADNFEPGPTFNEHAAEQSVNDYSVDRQMEPVSANLSDVSTVGDDLRNDEKKAAQNDLSSVLNSPVMFKHPTHLITPSEILMAASSSESVNPVEARSESDGNIQDVLVNGDVSNAELEVKIVGETRSTQTDEYGPQGETKEKYFCSQASDLGIEMARECSALSAETYITDEAHQVDDGSTAESSAQPSHAVGEDQDSTKAMTNSESSATTTANQTQTTNSKAKKQKGRSIQASGPSSSPNVLNSIDSSCEPGGGSNPEAAFPQIMSMQDMLNQVIAQNSGIL